MNLQSPSIINFPYELIFIAMPAPEPALHPINEVLLIVTVLLFSILRDKGPYPSLLVPMN
jgi:hypothetical protein